MTLLSHDGREVTRTASGIRLVKLYREFIMTDNLFQDGTKMANGQWGNRQVAKWAIAEREVRS